MSFQNCPSVLSPLVVVGSRLQGTNESSDFTRLANAAGKKVSKALPQATFLGSAVDGVSTEGYDVCTAILDFLYGRKNYVMLTYVNHNSKSLRYQLCGGSCVTTIGHHVLDADLLRVAGVTNELFRVQDFASDASVLRLFSSSSIQKLSNVLSEGEKDFSAGDIGCLSLALFMVRLHLHAVNGNNVPFKHRVI